MRKVSSRDAAALLKQAEGAITTLVEENRKLKELVGNQALVIEAQKKINGILPR